MPQGHPPQPPARRDRADASEAGLFRNADFNDPHPMRYFPSDIMATRTGPQAVSRMFPMAYGTV